MRTALLLLLVLAGGVAPSAALAQQISMGMLWKARALEASERLEKTSSLPTSPERFEELLEAAFLLHATQASSVHKVDATGEAFHIIMNGGGKSGLFDLVYVYDNDGSQLGVRVELLPKGWQIAFVSDASSGPLVAVMEDRRRERGFTLAEAPKPLIVSTGTVNLVFDLVDPFHPFVMGRVLKGPGSARPDPTPPPRPTQDRAVQSDDSH